MHMQTITRNLSPAALALVIGLAGALASEAVLAHAKGRPGAARSAGVRPHHHQHHHHHRHLRVFVGAGVALGAWPAYPRHIVAAAPVYYIERGDTAREDWFYYCPAAGAYYPYVAECAGGWQRVPAQPPQ